MEQPHQDATGALPQGALPQGTLPKIGGYKLLRLIGHGGMSTVYLAEQESLGRKVAVKVMLPEALADEVSRRRFENEARTIARLDHPNIVGIYEVGRTRDDLPYYAMPYLGRGHLASRISRQNGHTRDQAKVIATLRALLEALDYAHVRGVVHRDVKAENVLFDDAERPLLADFGIALRKGINPRLTMTGLAVGSTAYMPPEQARGEEVDSRADLYSIGVLAWEMLMGELPFNAGDALSMAVMHAKDPIPRLPVEFRHWQRFIDRAMAKHPGSRFRSAQQMLEALARIERGGFSTDALLANTASLWHRLRSLPMPALLGGTIAIAAIGGFAWYRSHAPGSEDFFRAQIAAQTVPDAPADPVDTMLAPPPESPASEWIAAAQRQLGARHLTSPEGDNAYDSVLTAWNADSAHEGMGATIDAVINALGDEMASRLRGGDEARARDYLQRATHLANQTAPLGAEAIRSLHGKAADALKARVATDEKRRERDDAIAAAALANEFAGDQALGDALRARADKITPAAVSGSPQAVAGTTSAPAVLPPVTRAEYERFANATHRGPALCREKLSVLRLLKPRDWRTVEGPGSAVVCVSWQDANAYAQWASRSGKRYRLPSGNELQGPGIPTWLRDGSLAGRSRQASRALDPQRGYEDVGIRLVRE
jgi:tRNA A-37 threonylcarbamoyl transferase component Bud32